MSIKLLVQLSGGIVGWAIAYIIYRLVELPYERSTAEARIKFEAEMEEIRKQKERTRNNK